MAQALIFHTADVQPSATHHDTAHGVRRQVLTMNEVQIVDWYRAHITFAI